MFPKSESDVPAATERDHADAFDDWKAELVEARRTWPQGPWMDEPDRHEWRTAAGYPGLVVRNWFGALCGYAGVPASHPAYGKDCDGVRDISAHGGLTYAGRCSGAICHIPQPGESDDVWWLGFDCLRAWDYAPGRDIALYASRILAGGMTPEQPAPGPSPGLIERALGAIEKAETIEQLDAIGQQLHKALAERYPMSTARTETYRDMDYVTAEVESLAKQLKDMEVSGAS